MEIPSFYFGQTEPPFDCMKRLQQAVLLILWGLSPGIASAADPAAPAGMPNVVLITLDTTRADRMGFLGSKRGLTPQLDAVAKQGVVFTRAYSQAPLTPVSHATLFTGTYPQFHKVNDFGVKLPEHLPALADLLKKRGYRTAAFVGTIIFDPINGMAPGFDRGFDTYDAHYRRRLYGQDRYKTMERRAEQVVARALAWLKANSSTPFFLWVHVFDPHEPYEAPPPFKERFAKAPYDGEIAYTDAQMGKIFSALRAAGVYDNTLITVFSDHGESLGAHNENTHGVFLYDETIHVPLFMKFPGNRNAGKQVTAAVGLVDVAPTLLEALGMPVPREMQGQSMLRLIGAPAPRDRPVYSQTDYPRRAFGWSALASWRDGRYLYVRAPRPELYDLAADPAAKFNLAATQKSVADRLGAALEAFRSRSSGSSAAEADRPVDPKVAEKLRSLGYVAGGTQVASAQADGIDPKDKIQVANLMQDAQHAIEEGRHTAVIPLLEKVVATDPQIFLAQLQLGTAYSRQRQYAKAVAPLRKATEMLPDHGLSHYELGLALFRTGDMKTAAGHFEVAAGLIPQWADAHFSVASVWARTNRVPEAVDKLALTLEMDPLHYQANLLMGRILTLSGKPAEGLPFLEKATQSDEASGEAHQFLADALERLGRTADAERERARAAQVGLRNRTP
jgi:arylsulfatase A-like enzyme/Tfp pilus assembly protein PilF